MKKKNKNIILKNKQNKILNNRYKTTFKNLKILIINKIKLENINYDNFKLLLNKYYSAIDKAVKKNVLKSNNASRKKSKMFKLYKNIN